MNRKRIQASADTFSAVKSPPEDNSQRKVLIAFQPKAGERDDISDELITTLRA